MNPRYVLGTGALMIGSAINYFGDRLLGVTLELSQESNRLAAFSFVSMVDVFVLPFIVGFVVAWIFGMGGKWLCYFPPLIVRCVAYAQIRYVTGVPPDHTLLPLGWWGFWVILAMEAAAIGGVLGEVVIKRIYGRTRAPAAAPTLPPDPTP